MTYANLFQPEYYDENYLYSVQKFVSGILTNIYLWTELASGTEPIYIFAISILQSVMGKCPRKKAFLSPSCSSQSFSFELTWKITGTTSTFPVSPASWSWTVHRSWTALTSSSFTFCDTTKNQCHEHVHDWPIVEIFQGEICYKFCRLFIFTIVTWNHTMIPMYRFQNFQIKNEVAFKQMSYKCNITRVV